MQPDIPTRRKPGIILSELDSERLSSLALAVEERSPEVAEELLAEIERAEVVAVGAVPPHVVQMGSAVRFTAAEGAERQVTLVFPAEADIAQGRISILTPIGAALIGLAEGQSMAWTTRDGREQRLTVLSVEPPATQPSADAGSPR